MELKEVFSSGIEIIDGMAQQYLTPSDKALRVKLVGAVEIIEKRLNNLSNYNGKMQSFMKLPKEMAEAAKEGTKAGEKFPKNRSY